MNTTVKNMEIHTCETVSGKKEGTSWNVRLGRQH